VTITFLSCVKLIVIGVGQYAARINEEVRGAVSTFRTFQRRDVAAR
jgi:hypothetical protein